MFKMIIHLSWMFFLKGNIFQIGRQGKGGGVSCTTYFMYFNKNVSFDCFSVIYFCRILRGCRLQNLGLFSGERTYYLTGVLAELEHALINWSVDVLHQKVSYILTQLFKLYSLLFFQVPFCLIFSPLLTFFPSFTRKIKIFFSSINTS